MKRRQWAGGRGLFFFTLFFLSMGIINGYHTDRDAITLIAAIVAWVVALACAFVFSYVKVAVNEQVAEDTCVEHGVLCCPKCFDMNDESRDPGTETEE